MNIIKIMINGVINCIINSIINRIVNSIIDNIINSIINININILNNRNITLSIKLIPIKVREEYPSTSQDISVMFTRSQNKIFQHSAIRWVLMQRAIARVGPRSQEQARQSGTKTGVKAGRNNERERKATVSVK
jgi:hypothetical protein